MFLWQSRTGRLQHFLLLSSTLLSLLDTYLFSFSFPPSAFSCITSGGISGTLQGVCASRGKAVRRREGVILRLSSRTCLAVEPRAEPATGATSPTKTPTGGGKTDLHRGRYTVSLSRCCFSSCRLLDPNHGQSANLVLKKEKKVISSSIHSSRSRAV